MEKAMAPHSSTLAWKIPWAEEPGRVQSMGSRRVGHDWVTSLSLFTFMQWRRKWQPTPVFLPGESQGQGSLVGCRLIGLHRVGHDWSDLAPAANWCLSCSDESCISSEVHEVTLAWDLCPPGALTARLLWVKTRSIARFPPREGTTWLCPLRWSWGASNSVLRVLAAYYLPFITMLWTFSKVKNSLPMK